MQPFGQCASNRSARVRSVAAAGIYQAPNVVALRTIMRPTHAGGNAPPGDIPRRSQPRPHAFPRVPPTASYRHGAATGTTMPRWPARVVIVLRSYSPATRIAAQCQANTSLISSVINLLAPTGRPSKRARPRNRASAPVDSFNAMRHRLGSGPEGRFQARSGFGSPEVGLPAGFQGAIVRVLLQCFRDLWRLIRAKVYELSIIYAKSPRSAASAHPLRFFGRITSPGRAEHHQKGARRPR